MEVVTQKKKDKKGQYSDDQAGGHPGSIIHLDDKILKKAKATEINFYKWLYEDERSKEIKQLKQFLPKFEGTKLIEDKEFLVLENLHNGYDNPNVMDCKLGRITWTKHDTPEKVEVQKKKNSLTTCVELGFRLTGILVKNEKGENIYNKKKSELDRTVNKDTVNGYFAKIVSFNNVLQKNIIEDLIKKTQEILNFFKNQKEKTFIASSLYYVIGKNGKYQVRYIDVAHPQDAEEEYDNNVIEGIEGILGVWKSLLDS